MCVHVKVWEDLAKKMMRSYILFGVANISLGQLNTFSSRIVSQTIFIKGIYLLLSIYFSCSSNPVLMTCKKSEENID